MQRPSPGALLPLGAIVGVASWLTLGSFDLIIRAGDAVRVAMLPPLWLLPVLAVAAWALLAAGHRLLVRLGAGPDEALDALMPLGAAALVVVPYLPWLPDAVPVLRVLGGPARWLIWFVILAQAVRLLLRLDLDLNLVPERFSARLSRPALAIALITATFCSIAAIAFTRSTLFPGGDEPHYLVMAQSLWRDGDLKIANNHRRGDYREYFDADLQPHYLTRGRDGAIYSVHPIGMPVFIAPIYALGGYRLVAWTMIALATGAATMGWVLVKRVTGSAEAATIGWAACCLTGPFIFNSFTVYPEIPAAFVAMAAFLLAQTSTPTAANGTWERWMRCGLAASALPWLSTKYAPMSAALILIALGRLWLPTRADGDNAPSLAPDAPSAGDAQDARGRAPAAAEPPARLAVSRWRGPIASSVALLTPYAISLAGWFAYFYVTWGTFSPSAPYGTQQGAGLRFLPAGGPGLLFDQEYGIVFFAPALLLALTGLVAMLRRGGTARRLALEVCLAFGALLATVGAFHIWWGGSATVGRPVMSGFLLLAVPLAWRYHDRRDRAGSRALVHVTMAIGAAIALTLGLAQQGLLLAAGRDGASALLEWLSPTWSAWSLAPSYIVQSPVAASILTALWLLAACALGWWIARRRFGAASDGRAALQTMVGGAIVIAGVSLIVPRVAPREDAPLGIVTMQARSRLLDTFDASRRPFAIVFDPWHRVAADSVPSLVQLTARPDERRPRQPIPLLYNARWALPAGRYALTLVFPRNAAAANPSAGSDGVVRGSVSLQVGRVGAPVQTWDVEVTAPGVWGRSFDLPIDANLVGFVASPEIQQAAPELRLSAVSVVDAHQRLPPVETLAATALGQTRVYFHDERVWLDGDGFWTPGASSVALTLAPPPAAKATVVRLTAGPVPTTVRLRADDRRDERVTLAPKAVRDVTIDADGDRPIRLTLDTDGGFIPARVEAGNPDGRQLGCFVEIVTR